MPSESITAQRMSVRMDYRHTNVPPETTNHSKCLYLERWCVSCRLRRLPRTSLGRLRAHCVRAFLDYFMNANGKCTRQYMVCGPEDFVGTSLHRRVDRSQFKFHVHRTEVIRRPANTTVPSFPLRAKYCFANDTPEGLEGQSPSFGKKARAGGGGRGSMPTYQNRKEQYWKLTTSFTTAWLKKCFSRK